jgi:hypothetical protein
VVALHRWTRAPRRTRAGLRLMQGFGWSFYAFFLFCIVWIAGYFAWARWMAGRDRERRSEK